MSMIVSIGVCTPPYRLAQETTVQFARELFKESFDDIERLLKVFDNGQIKERYFSVPLEWFGRSHSFEEKNNMYIEKAIEFGINAITNCLTNLNFLSKPIPYEEIDAIFFISSSGISTPSIEAKIMNKLPFNMHCKRIPIWGLGCAGGAAGISRAYEYCKAFPKSKVLVLSVELCSLTFQRNDHSKSNLVGTSIFADGVACTLICGDEANYEKKLECLPKIVATQSTLMPNSEDVMGWEIKNDGFFVIFSKDIPCIIRTWLRSNVEEFLTQCNLSISDITQFVAHPGGKKVLVAYREALGFPVKLTELSEYVLEHYGNMSSATIFYVLMQFMEKRNKQNEYGLLTALGPGFSSELLLLHWE
ncbi:type III polyketide synthase [Bacillus sp. Marseille-P3661]|uniref:type III polyketide synthase n=1 Tax=Bacillus sp. Marseille-P3661 TaxID=1936234 RepID=UPI000C816B1E|nr:3-oxoacyl-[acyl-carrier-protein] synthase III C-terminal domain-containing protein [Bacillus sp. Marseille-P3661]